ncbi:unnamed protein product [Symbiodinium sp. CCMP2592]|uniref:Uncharacterized protein n=1 Tax=Symbiodinium necroappetens TaxID=1628268 RepID=A0A812P1K9_9DINO|nr:unnamed protein product [Symbiodinium sp. KB8]CAE7346252.1 unnamed protein product [Symbiodinium necroappetens]CAE7391675.1 unnamed protein product [Symbiodinium microadriaticum]CAE7451490.1 unnamed protein product [Symbiodinium sp. CCMP2592]CAE7478662.1 unnamed protein product [Symbiodinium sp. CCMP2456]|eukprot:CAMPEP_0181454062 /NCGR_PEP_ID=MMETSP1110-20121109/30044_1 /TAXON_ID=174948 /ORGANISM="Symbiodinium sp., Strain CCMP421" /LENGTH=87 /DNA_ID=CAMNT_0023578395 /DNA_START=67 /DNA_END=330 /DNA_ORIENTATION=+
MEPGQGATQLAKATSTTALFSRIVARARGSQIPFVAGAPLAAEGDGVYAGTVKIALSNKFWMYYDNIVLLTLLMPAGFVWFMNRVPK